MILKDKPIFFLFYKNVTWLMFILLLFSLEWSTYLQTLSTTVTINTVTDYQSPGKAGETLPNSVNPLPRTHMVGVNLWPPPHVPHGVYVCRRWWVHTHTQESSQPLSYKVSLFQKVSKPKRKQRKRSFWKQ